VLGARVLGRELVEPGCPLDLGQLLVAPLPEAEPDEVVITLGGDRGRRLLGGAGDAQRVRVLAPAVALQGAVDDPPGAASPPV
jgi:hypothetical protein